MNDLLKLAIEGHGGLPRWEQVSRFWPAASITGAIWALKGKPGLLDAVVLEGGTRDQRSAGALEYAMRCICANAVAPRIIKTPMHPAEMHEAFAKLHPVGRVGEIRDVVGAVLFLESAPFVTGEILHVDGGQRAGH